MALSNGETIPESPYMGKKKIAVVVTPYSTGCMVAQEVQKRGYLLIAVWTIGFAEVMKTHVPKACGRMDYFAEIDQAETLEETKQRLFAAAKEHEIFCCFAGGEAGVDFADAFSEYLGVLSNGTDIPNRRDKYVQQELIRKAGLRAVRQAGGTKLEEVESFLQTESYPIVLKPTESAGSDGVKLCYTYEDAAQHFDKLMKSQLVNGGECPSVLCQEFLKGDEYVIDHVSRDGVHKTVMLWVYDKRKANGGDFVYFGMKAVDPTTEQAKILINYVRRTLDVLGIKNGPSHGEVMMTSEGPCLVEMNCRAHGGDGAWRPLALALTGGYSQVEGAADTFCDPKAFSKLPDRPPYPFKAAGQVVMLVSYSKGKVKSTPGYEVLRMLPSCVHMDGLVQPGAEVDYTQDLITCIGQMVMMHEDPDIVKRDIEFIRLMEQINGFFVYEQTATDLFKPDDVLGPKGTKNQKRAFSSDGPNLIRIMSNDRPELRGPLMKHMTTLDSSKEAVVVVDPYSTGAVVADEVMKRGFSVIALWSKGVTADMKEHIPVSCGTLNYIAQIDAEDDLLKISEAAYKAAGTKKIVACFAGTQTGVNLADQLSEQMKVRTNGTHVSNRSDKVVQQDVIRKHGLRCLRQVRGEKFADVEEFVKTEPLPVVLKPADGNEGVTLCHSIDEAKEHFELLMKTSSAILCQEFLSGTEYVVDHVSRDGDHKTMMIWKYDKRPCNGAPLVYFGTLPVDSDTYEAKILIPYVRGVLTALEVENGATSATVTMSPNGPCLVEMNLRPHGGDAIWRPIAMALTGGYSQIDVTVDSYLDRAKFSTIPSVYPSPFKAAGQVVYLVSKGRGTVRSVPGFDIIKELPSFVYLETGVRPGSSVDFTTDLFSALGCVVLMHRDPEVVKADVNRIGELEEKNEIIDYEPRI
ncbi:ATP-grasp domain containing protein [Nitzschia inconspicua]|uniref:ATP-grasp domain containing protein n=1 Tax=Nitzschia inconspicua TaxID=303405 RepID=A0A9K3LK62_9STRA|nr:ATP-grasp domain containing protein [Nitzschia inconspicua]